MIKIKLTDAEEREAYTIEATAGQWIGFARLLSEALPQNWRQEGAVTDQETSVLMKASLPVMRALSEILRGIESNHILSRTVDKQLN